MIIDLFIPCYLDHFFPDTAMNMVKVLEKVGCGVNYNTEQTCCGRPALLDGYTDHCKEIGTKFIHEFQNDRYIVAPDSSCVAMIKNHYPSMFHNTVLHNEYKSIQKHIYEFSDFLVNVMHVTDVNAHLEATVTYHDACNALRELNIKQAPRTLLSKVRGLKLVEMNDCETCCGFGGGMAARIPHLADNIANQKTENIINANVDYVVSTDMGCLQHLQKSLHLKGSNTKVIHIADVLATAL